MLWEECRSLVARRWGCTSAEEERRTAAAAAGGADALEEELGVLVQQVVVREQAWVEEWKLAIWVEQLKWWWLSWSL